MEKLRRVSICGVKIHNVDMEEAVEACLSLAGTPAAVYTPNAEISKAAMDDPQFLAVLNAGDLVVADGAGVVLAARQLGTPLKGKVAGAELAQRLLPRLEQRGLKLFLFGGKPGVAERAAEKIRKAHPDLILCGTADGYFSDEEQRVAAIEAARPDVVYVCLGFPKQERFIHRYRQRCGALMLGLGGTLDLLAGDVERAPEFFLKHNLEWLYRGGLNPKRWRRLMKIPAFLWEVRREAGRRRIQETRTKGDELP